MKERRQISFFTSQFFEDLICNNVMHLLALDKTCVCTCEQNFEAKCINKQTKRKEFSSNINLLQKTFNCNSKDVSLVIAFFLLNTLKENG